MVEPKREIVAKTAVKRREEETSKVIGEKTGRGDKGGRWEAVEEGGVGVLQKRYKGGEKGLTGSQASRDITVWHIAGGGGDERVGNKQEEGEMERGMDA